MRHNKKPLAAEPRGYTLLMKNFRNLTNAQSDVFEQIAVGNDGGHNPKVLDRLEKMGLLISKSQILSGYPPVMIKRYEVPIDIHIEWCQWCSEIV